MQQVGPSSCPARSCSRARCEKSPWHGRRCENAILKCADTAKLLKPAGFRGLYPLHLIISVSVIHHCPILTAFPFDKVKIDKSFIDRIDRCETVAVLKSIVQLAKTLKLSIVAEGVETSEQVTRVHSLGIALGQGYFFSRPEPLANLSLQSPVPRRRRRAVA